VSEPIQRCLVCGDYEIVKPDGRGFPPDIAGRKLAKRCKARGHMAELKYTAGFNFNIQQAGLEAAISEQGAVEAVFNSAVDKMGGEAAVEAELAVDWEKGTAKLLSILADEVYRLDEQENNQL